jgi:hypothetical protein
MNNITIGNIIVFLLLTFSCQDHGHQAIEHNEIKFRLNNNIIAVKQQLDKSNILLGQIDVNGKKNGRWLVYDHNTQVKEILFYQNDTLFYRQLWQSPRKKMSGFYSDSMVHYKIKQPQISYGIQYPQDSTQLLYISILDYPIYHVGITTSFPNKDIEIDYLNNRFVIELDKTDKEIKDSVEIMYFTNDFKVPFFKQKRSVSD